MSTCVEDAVGIMSQTNFTSALEVHVHVSSVDICRCIKHWADVSSSERTSAVVAAGAPTAGNNATTVAEINSATHSKLGNLLS